MNTCHLPNLNEVDKPTPVPKPPSPHNTPSKENPSIAPSTQASPQHYSPLLIDPYVDVVLKMHCIRLYCELCLAGNRYCTKGQKQSKKDKTEYGIGKSARRPKPKAYPFSMDQPRPT
nr:hypothetical protein [Tanacetum cinerariifolium]